MIDFQRLQIPKIIFCISLAMITVLGYFSTQPIVSLKDLGLSDIGVNQLDELVSRLLPVAVPEGPPTPPSIWRTSHVSGDSFFHNKHGEQSHVVQQLVQDSL